MTESIPSVTLLGPATVTGEEALKREFVAEEQDKRSVTGTSHVFIVKRKAERHSLHPTLYAIKQQPIRDTLNLSDKAFRELRTFLRLNRLYEDRKCPNFVRLLKWRKCSTPLFTPPGKTSHHNAYLIFVLEYVGEVLSKYKLSTVAELRCILFQLLFALYVAQKECQFVHLDFHSKNLLVKDLPSGKKV